VPVATGEQVFEQAACFFAPSERCYGIYVPESANGESRFRMSEVVCLGVAKNEIADAKLLFNGFHCRRKASIICLEEIELINRFGGADLPTDGLLFGYNHLVYGQGQLIGRFSYKRDSGWQFVPKEQALQFPEPTDPKVFVAANAEIIAERLRERVYQTELGIIDGQLLPKVSISLGVTEYRPNHTLEELIAAADVAMYQAKQNGRNRVQIARPS